MHAHNILLHIAAEQGVLGLLLFLYIAFSAFRISAAGITAGDGENRWWNICALAALTGFFVHETVNYYINYPALALPFWLIIGGISAGDGRHPVRSGTGRIVSALLLLLAAALLILSARIGAARWLYDGGRELYEQGRYAAALEKLSRAADWDAGLPLYHVYVGKACYRLYEKNGAGRYLDAAVTAYEQAVWESQTEPRYLLDLSALYLRTGDKARLLELHHRKKSLYPRPPEIAVSPKEYDCRPGFVDISGKATEYNKYNLSKWDILVNKRKSHWGLLAPLGR